MGKRNRGPGFVAWEIEEGKVEGKEEWREVGV